MGCSRTRDIGRMGNIGRHSAVWGLCLAGPVMAAAAPAGGVFDGSYSGPKAVTYGTEPVCGSAGDTSVMVRDGEIQAPFGDFALKLAVGSDGRLAGRVRKGNRGGGQSLRIRGQIHDDLLEANFVVNGVHGHLCSYHWALRRV